MKKVIILMFVVSVMNALNAQPCLPEGITFTTQEQIDNFQTNYPGCTEIEGDVTIFCCNISNLYGLSVLSSIGNNLSILENPNLTSLTGLNNLTSIGGDLIINYNLWMTSLNGLENLTTIGGNLLIKDNFSLTSLTELENLTSIGGYLWIANNYSITSLSGLDNIAPESITDLRIYGQSLLTDCEIQNICNYLNSPNGTVEIQYNGSGCNSVFEVANSCGISSLPCLPFGDYYFISQSDIDNFQLLFPNCTELEGVVFVHGNNITNLNGLNVLTSIGGYLYIIDNNALTSLAGLDNITAGSITTLDIRNNYSLSTCEVQSICDYLASPNGTVTIFNNAPGCNNPEEVMEACVTSVDEANAQNGDIIIPNPFSDELTITYPLSESTYTSIEIYNSAGKKVKELSHKLPSEGRQVYKIKTNDLPAGIYFCVLKTKEGLQTKKIIKL